MTPLVALADLGYFRGGDFRNPSKRSERALKGSGLTGEIIVKKLNSLKHLVRTTVAESHN